MWSLSCSLDGLPKTPDIVLEYPILIETAAYPGIAPSCILHCTGWKEVNWIESKAIFGDGYWQGQNAQQFFSYINRLGPGCVIYISCSTSLCILHGKWFGFIDGYTTDPRITILSSLPTTIHTINTTVPYTVLLNKCSFLKQVLPSEAITPFSNKHFLLNTITPFSNKHPINIPLHEPITLSRG